MQLLVLNEECLVVVLHYSMAISSLPFVRISVYTSDHETESDSPLGTHRPSLLPIEPPDEDSGLAVLSGFARSFSLESCLNPVA